MIENYQEEKELDTELAEPTSQNFATVGAVYSDGLSLIFDGTSTATTKHYKCNTFFKYAAGDRVHILKDSGTYVVICVIGDPATSIASDTATTAETAANATTAETAQTATSATSATTAGGLKKGNFNVTVDTDGTLKPSQSTQNLGSASAPYNEAYIKEIAAGGAAKCVYISQFQCRPNGGATYDSFYLGTSSYPWHNAYIGKTLALLGTTTTSKLGFFGTTPITKLSLSTSSANMSYSSATSSNYLNVINNIAGILKKYGLIS